MNRRKNLVALAIVLCLTTLLSATNLGPSRILPGIVPVKAITCPSGGSGPNACLTVSLDAISKPTTVASTTCDVNTAAYGQFGLCDILINTASTNVTTFRVGAILNASATSPSGSTANVFAWQFQINYDPTVVTPLGDPSSLCIAYPDCGEKTVWFGSQLNTGTGNWAKAISIGAGNPGGGTGAVSISENLATHTGAILVGFTFVNPTISPPIILSARTVLANVAFALVSRAPATFTISNVQFTDQNAIILPGFAAAPATPCSALSCGQETITINNTPPTASFTTTHTGTSYTFTSTSSDPDVGGSIANLIWDFGDKTPLVTGVTTVITHDYGMGGFRTAPGLFNVTLRAVDNLGATGAARGANGAPLINGQPSHTFTNLGLVELGPRPSFTFNPANPNAGQTVTFDASGSSYPDEPILAGVAPVGGSGISNVDNLCLLTIGIPCPIGFVDANANGRFDPGVDTVVRDQDASGTFTAGDTIMAGPTIAVASQPIVPDAKLSYFDTNVNGQWDAGEPVIYDTNGNSKYDGIVTYAWNSHFQPDRYPNIYRYSYDNRQCWWNQ